MSDAYAGEIRIFPYMRKTLINWLPCDGRSLNIADFQVLYSVIGTQYGGDGVRNFNIPDFRGRVPVGQGTLNRPPSPPQTFTMGQKGGEETVTLAEAHGASHTHTVNATTAASTTPTPGETVMMASSDTYKHYSPVPAQPNYNPLDPNALDSNGAGFPHINIMPSLGLDVYICTTGLYPVKP